MKNRRNFVIASLTVLVVGAILVQSSDDSGGLFSKFSPEENGLNTSADSARKRLHFTADREDTANRAHAPGGMKYTGQNQSGPPLDIEIIRQIRRQITSRGDLSSDAKSIAIRAIDGAVILRGRVDTPNEKTIVRNIAADVVGLRNVDDQMEVK